MLGDLSPIDVALIAKCDNQSFSDGAGLPTHISSILVELAAVPVREAASGKKKNYANINKSHFKC